MRVRIIVSDDDGNNYQGEVELARSSSAKPARKPVARETRPRGRTSLPVNFSSNIRAFVKKHGRGMRGPQKFALLVAYLSKGEPKKEVSIANIRKHWNKMTQLLGGKFIRVYSQRAKEYGWVDSPRTGVYELLPDWKGALDG